MDRGRGGSVRAAALQLPLSAGFHQEKANTHPSFNRVSFPEKTVIASEENQPSLVHSSPEEGEESSPKQVQEPRAQAELGGPALRRQRQTNL